MGQSDFITVCFRIQPLLSCQHWLLRLSEKNYSGPADCPSPKGAAAARTIRCRHFAIGALENSRWSYEHLYLAQRNNTVISDVTDLRLQVKCILLVQSPRLWHSAGCSGSLGESPGKQIPSCAVSSGVATSGPMMLSVFSCLVLVVWAEWQQPQREQRDSSWLNCHSTQTQQGSQLPEH